MRDTDDRTLALQCLRLALENAQNIAGGVLDNAAGFFAFVSGTDVDDAKRKLDAVREITR